MKKKVFILFIAAVLLVRFAVMYIPNNGKIIFDDYAGTAFEEELSRAEGNAVKRILFGKVRWPEWLYGVPACGFGRSYAIMMNGIRYMIAWDSCGVLCAENAAGVRTYIDISDADKDILEAMFESRIGR